ncbi:hypothetical protein AV530_002685 [Patagioenas fasciata monilis]|uniref:Uncharacterized protein n=1 Tax=Patagioenas fasciata monilis TaxID=372326 RepID=A0A1V4IQ16_PATFA|nr:hypothetical protein AV530_002685 [Patagioenas fasciata monilis]
MRSSFRRRHLEAAMRFRSRLRSAFSRSWLSASSGDSDGGVGALLPPSPAAVGGTSGTVCGSSRDRAGGNRPLPRPAAPKARPGGGAEAAGYALPEGLSGPVGLKPLKLV